MTFQQSRKKTPESPQARPGRITVEDPIHPGQIAINHSVQMVLLGILIDECYILVRIFPKSEIPA